MTIPALKLPVFKLEDYLTTYEFSAPYLLCCSDVDTLSMKMLLSLAGEEEKNQWETLTLGYTQPHGLPELRHEIAAAFYHGLKADNILCFAGAEEGIFAALHTVCRPQDHAVVLTPCYQSLLEIPRLKGAAITCIPLEESRQWRIDLARIEAAILPNTRCLIINFPHNPTGQIITEGELNDLTQLCRRHDLWLFSDEVYHLLGTPNTPWALPAACLYEKALSLGVMSKAFGLAGLRIGWIACQDLDLLNQLKQTKDYLSICNSAPSECLALIALKNKDFILRKNNQLVANNLKALDSFLTAYSHLFSWVKPQGGCVGFVKFNGAGPVDDFCKKLVDEKGVLLLPASVYNEKTPHFRVGFGRKNMIDALSKVEDFLEP